MNRLSVFVITWLALAGVLLSCKKESESLQVQIEAVVTTDINPIKKQIEEINSSIADLEQTATALRNELTTAQTELNGVIA